MKNVLSIVALAAVVCMFGLGGCKEKSPAEKVGDSVEKAADKAGSAVEKAGDEVKKSTDGH